MSWRPVVDHTRKTKTEYMYVEEKKEDRRYRVFAWHGQYLGQSQDASQLSEFEAGTDNPSHVTGLRVTAVSPSQIDISWNKLTETGSSPLKEYEIYGVKLDTSVSPPTFTTYLGSDEEETDTQLRATSKTESYSHTKRSAGATWKYRVIPVSTNTDNPRPTAVGEALEDQATTPQATVPEAPEGLVAEDAKSSNLPGASNRGVLLMWNAPGQPDGATITSYRIQRNIDDGAWETLVGKTTTLHTDYTDTKEWKVGEMRMYRVAAFSGNVMGAWATVAYPAMMHNPSMPTAVMAEKDSAMPASQIKVSWSKPARGVADGYIIERRYGDMMMDITGYSGTDGANRYHAFMNYKEWWETLNCDGMLQAANIAPADATDEQKGMYCKQFLATAPSMVPDTEANADKKISDETAMKVKDLFMKRYVTDDMGKTMTMFTGMMYTDMGLMENTEYTYRVRAIHGMKAGMWSDTAMAMTDRANTAPMAVGTIADQTVTAGAMSDPMDVSGYFSDADMGDTLTYTAMSNMTSYATADIPAGSSMLTITGVAAGSATVTVTATDAAGAYAMQTIMVTIEAADMTPTSPSNVMATPDDTDPGDLMITVTWTDGENVEAYGVVLFNSDFSEWPYIARGMNGSHTFSNVDAGSYVAVVVALDADGTLLTDANGDYLFGPANAVTIGQ